MSWKKLGLVFAPSGQHSWMQTHASTPFPVALGGDDFRVFFSTRDAQNQSSITSLDMRLLPNPEVLSITQNPIVSPGLPGYFDDSGATMSQLIRWQGRDYLYYIGWNLAAKMPFRNAIGLAIAEAGTTQFEKFSPAPILDRSHADPISLSYPWITIEDGTWRMWYGSHTTVEQNGLDVEHVLKYAESKDGISWCRTGQTCIKLHEGESGVVRPSIIKDASGYHMWYSVRIGRKETYRLGYAISPDGLTWQRRDEQAALTASPDPAAWDYEMICYPCVFEHNTRRYMLYNGNSFGRSGFGLALWEAK